MCYSEDALGYEPQNYNEAMISTDSETQKKSIQDELISHHQNEKWILGEKPRDAQAIGCK